jgi:hypothetical protein
MLFFAGFFEQIISQLRLLMDISVGGWTWNGAKFSCRGYEAGKRILQAPSRRVAEILKLSERKGVQYGRVRERHGHFRETDLGLV